MRLSRMLLDCLSQIYRSCGSTRSWRCGGLCRLRKLIVGYLLKNRTTQLLFFFLLVDTAGLFLSSLTRWGSSSESNSSFLLGWRHWLLWKGWSFYLDL